MEVPQQIRTIIQSSNSTSGYFSKENESPNWKRHDPYVRYSTVYNSQDTEATQASIDRRLERKCGGGFPGGSVVSSLLVNAEDTGPISDPEAPTHCTRACTATVPVLLSPGATATKSTCGRD